MRHPSAGQRTAIEGLQERGFTVEWDSGKGIVRRLRGSGTAGFEVRATKQDDAVRVLRDLAKRFELFGTDGEDVQLLRARTDDLKWQHIELQQVLKDAKLPRGYRPPGTSKVDGVEIYGAKLVGHFDANGQLVEIQSSCWPWREGLSEARISSVKALQALLVDIGQRTRGWAAASTIAQREKLFPLMQEPRLVGYPWKDVLRLAWVGYAYMPIPRAGERGKNGGGSVVDLAQFFIDAETGEQLVVAPTEMHAENPTTGTGLAVTPLGGPFTARDLNVVQIDSDPDFRLKDTTHARNIVTYNTAGSPALSSKTEIAGALAAETLPVSSDSDNSWSEVAMKTTNDARLACQQPEADAHFFGGQLYEWYDALAGGTGRAGWDDGQYTSPPVPPQDVSIVTHAYDDDVNSVRSINAGCRRVLNGGNWFTYLQFFDGNPTNTCATPNDIGYDFISGSPFIVGHEYQHAITDFSFEDAEGNPGLEYQDWFAAVHEGVSDVFGALFSEVWTPGTDISVTGLVFRNLAYPRDLNNYVNGPCGSNDTLDHFDDSYLFGVSAYDRGTILAHASYLAAAGGVHQRSMRAPELIPVRGIGTETAGALTVLRAARLWYRAISFYFSTHGNLTGVPASDETAFRVIRDGCISAAVDLYGEGSVEQRQMILAFYAAGLHPNTVTYGADPTFLTWAADWWRSWPYVGIDSPDWSSVDLFINNDGETSEWNALINADDGSGPTQFENDVYCRVRNVGDEEAKNVTVTFFWAKVGTAPTIWTPMADKDGKVQKLTVGTLGAGQLTFPDSDQNKPPTTARVKWWVPPIPSGETIEHYCIKAIVASSNDVNAHNNEVQSNVSYVSAPVMTESGFAFTAGNPTERTIALDLRLDHTLPRGWKTSLRDLERRHLKPREEVILHLDFFAPDGAGNAPLEAPFDGSVEGELSGFLTGHFAGILSEVRTQRGGRLTGRLTGHVELLGAIAGRFEGTLDRATAELRGKFHAAMQCDTGCCGETKRFCAVFSGCLRPRRHINVAQYIGGRAIGGFTIQVQLPGRGRCERPLPPTTTRVRARQQ